MSEYPILDLESMPLLVLQKDFCSFIAKITPSIAKRILDNYNYSHNRNLASSKINQLKTFMKDGSFAPETDSINFCVEGEKPILTDGQHRLTALIETSKSYGFIVAVSSKSASDIYPKTDRGKPRGLGDTLKTHQTAIKMAMPETFARQFAVGLRLIESGYTLSSHAGLNLNEERLLDSLVTNYKSEAIHILQILDETELKRKLLGRLPVSLWLTLYKLLPEKEHETIDTFLYGCSTGIGLQEGDPRRHVFTLYSRGVRRGGRSTKEAFTRKDELSLLLLAWEFWYNNKSIKTNFQSRARDKILSQSPNVAGIDITFK